MLKHEIMSLLTEKGSDDFRKFGRTMGIFLMLVGLVMYFVSSGYSFPTILTGLVILALGSFFPITLKPIFVLWMSLAAILGFIMTRFILGLIFFLIFSPIGLVFRLIKKDHLDEAIDPHANSYWKIRDSAPYEPGMSEKQS